MPLSILYAAKAVAVPVNCIRSSRSSAVLTSHRLSWLPDRRLFAESLLLNYLPGMETALTLLAGLIVLGALGIVYFAPTIVARGRGHHNLTALFALNLLLGWTLIGWTVALVWALMRQPPLMAPHAAIVPTDELDRPPGTIGGPLRARLGPAIAAAHARRSDGR